MCKDERGKEENKKVNDNEAGKDDDDDDGSDDDDKEEESFSEDDSSEENESENGEPGKQPVVKNLQKLLSILTRRKQKISTRNSCRLLKAKSKRKETKSNGNMTLINQGETCHMIMMTAARSQRGMVVLVTATDMKRKVSVMLRISEDRKNVPLERNRMRKRALDIGRKLLREVQAQGN